MMISGIGPQLTVVAVGLQIYALTGSTLAVAFVGGIALVPMVVAGLWGGMRADAFDRRKVLIISTTVGWLSTAAIAAFAITHMIHLADGGIWDILPYYVAVTINSIAATINGATRM